MKPAGKAENRKEAIQTMIKRSQAALHSFEGFDIPVGVKERITNRVTPMSCDRCGRTMISNPAMLADGRCRIDAICSKCGWGQTVIVEKEG